MATKAYIHRNSHVVGGVGAGIDSSILSVPTKCDVDLAWDADNIVDTYLQGTIFAYNPKTRSYGFCMGVTPGWRGYWSSNNQYWVTDMDTNPAGYCGWKSRPIKVRTIAKGEWEDGTIRTTTAFVTEPRL